MPELPEVEVVRRGLVSWVRGRTITAVEVVDPRSVRRHALGTEDFACNVEGTRVLDVVRRGKFLWMPLADTSADVPAAGSGNGAAESSAPAVALMLIVKLGVVPVQPEQNKLISTLVSWPVTAGVKV